MLALSSPFMRVQAPLKQPKAMQPSRTLQVFEHQALRVGTGLDGTLSQWHFDALLAWHDRQASRYFEPGYKKLTFGRWVGVIRVGDLTIEILPKADRGPDDAASKQAWHNNLLEMLRVTRQLKVEQSGLASLALRRYSLLDIYLNWFLEAVQVILHEELVKRYRQQDDPRSTALRGKLLFDQQLGNNAFHKERFACRRTIFDHDNLVNSILKCGLGLVRKVTSNSALGSNAEQLLLAFEGVTDQIITDGSFERIKWDRKTERYRQTITMARMIILGFSPDLRGGRNDVFALLFDMSQLWEEYVLRRLHQAARRYSGSCACEPTPFRDLEILGQHSKLFWERRKIRPDILVRGKRLAPSGGYIPFTVVLDTKWKLLRDNSPNDEDLRQMFVYKSYFACSGSVLLYPQAHGLVDRVGAFHPLPSGSDETGHCKVAFLRICDQEGRLDLNLGQRIMELHL